MAGSAVKAEDRPSADRSAPDGAVGVELFRSKRLESWAPPTVLKDGRVMPQGEDLDLLANSELPLQIIMII